MSPGGKEKVSICLGLRRRLLQIENRFLYLLWRLVHIVINLCCIGLDFANAVESSLISIGVYRKYKTLDVSKLQNLAIVIESEDAMESAKVIQLVQWVKAIGVSHVCLYDAENVLMKAEGSIIEKFNNIPVSERSTTPVKPFSVEIASLSDGKEGIVKAANFIFAESLLNPNSCCRQVSTESRLTEALKVVDAWGPDPDLLLVYGPARCHLGFPAWRIRYTEIVHMGPLMSMKYDDLVKAIYKFTMVRQNFGK